MSTESKKRYNFIDGIRGMAIVSMVLFHFCYDLFMVEGVDTSWYWHPFAHIWQQSICITFIFVSGFVWKYGIKKSLKRGLFLNLCGFIITAVTVIVMPEEAVWFGVLNFIGCAMIIMIAIDKLMGKLPYGVGIVLSLFLFILTRYIDSGYLSLGSVFRVGLPDFLYDIKIMTPLGFPFPGFVSSDYFPIMPWIFLYMLGYYCGLAFIKEENPFWQRIAAINLPILSWLGRKSIIVYMLHQPICMGIAMLVTFIFFRG